MPASCRSHSNCAPAGFEDANGGVGDVRTDAVAGDQRAGNSHRCESAQRAGAMRGRRRARRCRRRPRVRTRERRRPRCRRSSGACGRARRRPRRGASRGRLPLHRLEAQLDGNERVARIVQTRRAFAAATRAARRSDPLGFALDGRAAASTAIVYGSVDVRRVPRADRARSGGNTHFPRSRALAERERDRVVDGRAGTRSVPDLRRPVERPSSAGSARGARRARSDASGASAPAVPSCGAGVDARPLRRGARARRRRRRRGRCDRARADRDERKRARVDGGRQSRAMSHGQRKANHAHARTRVTAAR